MAKSGHNSVGLLSTERCLLEHRPVFKHALLDSNTPRHRPADDQHCGYAPGLFAGAGSLGPVGAVERFMRRTPYRFPNSLAHPEMMRPAR